MNQQTTHRNALEFILIASGPVTKVTRMSSPALKYLEQRLSYN